MIIYTHPEPDKEVVEMKGPISEDIEIQVRSFPRLVARYNIARDSIIGFARIIYRTGKPDIANVPFYSVFRTLVPAVDLFIVISSIQSRASILYFTFTSFNRYSD